MTRLVRLMKTVGAIVVGVWAVERGLARTIGETLAVVACFAPFVGAALVDYKRKRKQMGL